MRQKFGAASAMKIPSIAARRSVVLVLAVVGLALVAFAASSLIEGGGSPLALAGTTVTRLREFLEGTTHSHQSEEQTDAAQNIVVTSPKIEDVTITESFVCQIRSQRHIEVRTLEGGYIEHISINEGQSV
jgi:hypothetical protein